MTEEDDLVLNIPDDSESQKATPPHSLRHGIIFLIDATEPMFDIDPDTGKSYFAQCLQTYKNILAEKLSWNKTDRMGILLMGTNEWDKKPEIKHVLTWQSFEEVSIDQMIKIDKTLADVDKFRCEIGSSSDYPLHDALWHATRIFGAVKVIIPYRDIILLTRVDNPYADKPSERFRIRTKVLDCASLNIRLSVVGLGKEWDPKHFFTEVETCSGKYDGAGEYQRTLLADLEEEVKHASRNLAQLQWTLGCGVKIGVSVCTITAKTHFARKICLTKKDNEPLDGYTFYRKTSTWYSEDEEDGDEDEHGEADNATIALSKDVYKYQEFGGRGIKFSMQEVHRLSNSREMGIELLGFKPQSKLDISLHLEAPKFITYNDSELEGSKTLFAALLNKCEERNVMAVCVITLRARSASYLYTMMPNIKYGGFYAYKLPFAENVRDIAQVIPEYVYNETDNLCPLNEDTVDLCHKFIKKSTIAYNPTMFSNPKLHTEMASIASLAMDEELCVVPIDSTIIDKPSVCERLGELRDRFENVLHVHDQDKSMKRPSELSSNAPKKLIRTNDMPDFEKLVREQMVEKCTVKKLKDYLKSVGESTTGRKDDLVNTVYNLFNKS